MKNISQPGVNFRKALPCSEHLLNFALKPRVFYTKLVLYKNGFAHHPSMYK